LSALKTPRYKRPTLKVFPATRRKRFLVTEIEDPNHDAAKWPGIGVVFELFTFAEWDALPEWERYAYHTLVTGFGYAVTRFYSTDNEDFMSAKDSHTEAWEELDA
jgi:hypothetical protein